jgi:hypothetical protein
MPEPSEAQSRAALWRGESTAAIIVHHPQAKYFAIDESRVEQLTANR